MATFITTIQFTEQGTQNIKGTTKRANAFKREAKKLGVKVKDVCWTLGAPFDGAIILDAADDETIQALMMSLESQGNVVTQTTRAFNAKEMDEILSKI